jgi:hypothetical protein
VAGRLGGKNRNVAWRDIVVLPRLLWGIKYFRNNFLGNKKYF